MTPPAQPRSVCDAEGEMRERIANAIGPVICQAQFVTMPGTKFPTLFRARDAMADAALSVIEPELARLRDELSREKELTTELGDSIIRKIDEKAQVKQDLAATKARAEKLMNDLTEAWYLDPNGEFAVDLDRFKRAMSDYDEATPPQAEQRGG